MLISLTATGTQSFKLRMQFHHLTTNTLCGIAVCFYNEMLNDVISKKPEIIARQFVIAYKFCRSWPSLPSSGTKFEVVESYTPKRSLL